MPLLTKQTAPKPARAGKLQKLHVAARMNSFTARARAVHTELAGRLSLQETQTALGTDLAEARKFNDALAAFLAAVGG